MVCRLSYRLTVGGVVKLFLGALGWFFLPLSATTRKRFFWPAADGLSVIASYSRVLFAIKNYSR
jgi:hypothetical protein